MIRLGDLPIDRFISKSAPELAATLLQYDKVDVPGAGAFWASAALSDGSESPLGESDVVLDAVATAKLVCFKWLRRQNSQ